VDQGETVPVLSVVGLMTSAADEDMSGYEPAGAPRAAEDEASPAGPAVAEPATVPAAPGGDGRIFSSPRARKLAREKGVDLAQVSGTGPNGRIVERDVVTYLEEAPKVTPVARRLAEQAGVDLRAISGTGPGGRITKEDVELVLAPQPVAAPVVAAAPAAAAAAAVETPMAGIRAVIARRMYESHQLTAPVTLTTEADATDLVALRELLKASLAKELGFNIGYNDLLIKIAARVLRELPYMNARLDVADANNPISGTIKQLDGVHVALAVDTERGLLVPVIRDADAKGIAAIGREVRGVVERARSGAAAPDELTGSTFTITNLGMHEIDAFTPIINLPETAILGVGRIKPTAVVVDDAVVVRKTVWLSLTFDHRLVDGAPAARFLQRVKQLVEEPFLLLA
jgi:pyruvate dehydrogenase E2 component (dihydrolipoamide acetyltransferase)